MVPTSVAPGAPLYADVYRSPFGNELLKDFAIAAIEGYVSDNPRHGFDKLFPALRQPGMGKCWLYRV